jgi:TatD DNase family protein
MTLPANTDYIDIHTHGAESRPGFFSVENLMAHEETSPDPAHGIAYSCGIHPWFLNEGNHEMLICKVRNTITRPAVIAVGEAGFDRIKGPPIELQRRVFEQQVLLAEEHLKPVIIHCVRSWDELLQAHKRIKPKMPWLVHGFRGNRELARQLLSKGLYISFWFDYIIRPESASLIRSLPTGRIFLETDGSGISIVDIYNKVSADLGIQVDCLKSIVFSNFNEFFKINPRVTKQKGKPHHNRDEA